MSRGCRLDNSRPIQIIGSLQHVVEDKIAASTSTRPTEALSQISKNTYKNIQDVGKEDNTVGVSNNAKDDVDIMVDAIRLGL